jgi:hypothetical protein
MTTAGALDRARDSFGRHAWADAYAQLSALDQEAPLAPVDLERLDCVEQGYLLLPVALRSLAEGDPAAASATFRQAAKIGDRFGDVDLTTLARLGRGQALTRLGETAEGVALLDEVMVAVTAGEVAPVVVGIAYCGVIVACQDAFDVRRAQE